jgi:xanthine/uracil permease
MGPRRWEITGVCFLAVGALLFLFDETRGAASRALVIVGAGFSFVAVVVEVLLRVRLKALARRQDTRP